MPGPFRHELFEAVCGQFGNDNPHVRVSALDRANRMLSEAGLDWGSMLPGHGDWAEALASSDGLPDPVKAEAAARVNTSVVKGHGTWSAVLAGETAGGPDQGGSGDFQTIMEVEAFIRTYILGVTGRGAWGREPGWGGHARRPPPERQEPAPPEPLPVVVEGMVALATTDPAVPGRVEFMVTRDDGRVFGPFVALQPKVMTRVASGAGTRMRVTTRSGTGRMTRREATRAVSA